jgi:hemolysin activation/secretion protein
VVEQITIDGGFEPVAGRTNALLPKAGTQVSLADLYQLAATVQQAYLAAGYPLVRVFVPMQDLDRQNARIRLQVVSGYIGKVQTEARDPKIRSVVARYLASLVGQQNLSASALERAVLLAGNVPGVTLASALSPGTSTGETILIVSGDYQPIQAVLSFDNRLAPELGREQATLSIAFNGVLGLGERIGVTVATALDDPSFSSSALRRYGGIFVDLPVGDDGLVIGADAAISTARPRGVVTFLGLDSDFEHFGGRVSYPLIRSRRHRLVAFGNFNFNKETQASLLLGFPVPLSRDETRVGRIGLNGLVQSPDGLFASAEIEYSRGLDIFGARRASEATILEPLSRIGADAVFDKLTANLILEADVPKTPLVGRLFMRGQTGFGDALLRSEQLSVATPDMISGPPSGILVGDTAVGARFEAEAPIRSPGIQLVPYGFAAAAVTWLERPTLSELPRTDTHAFGIGFKAQARAGPFIINGRLEYSRTESDDLNVEGNWATFQIEFRF